MKSLIKYFDALIAIFFTAFAMHFFLMFFCWSLNINYNAVAIAAIDGFTFIASSFMVGYIQDSKND